MNRIQLPSHFWCGARVCGRTSTGANALNKKQSTGTVKTVVITRLIGARTRSRFFAVCVAVAASLGTRVVMVYDYRLP